MRFTGILEPALALAITAIGVAQSVKRKRAVVTDPKFGYVNTKRVKCETFYFGFLYGESLYFTNVRIVLPACLLNATGYHLMAEVGAAYSADLRGGMPMLYCLIPYKCYGFDDGHATLRKEYSVLSFCKKSGVSVAVATRVMYDFVRALVRRMLTDGIISEADLQC